MGEPIGPQMLLCGTESSVSVLRTSDSLSIALKRGAKWALWSHFQAFNCERLLEKVLQQQQLTAGR